MSQPVDDERDETPSPEAQDPNDAREMMRTALEKKNQRSKSGAAHLDGHPKAGRTHGKAGGARQFRRKSGG